jgi:hypothetical protein
LDKRETTPTSPTQVMDSGCSHMMEEKSLRILSDLNIEMASTAEEIPKKEEV